MVRQLFSKETTRSRQNQALKLPIKRTNDFESNPHVFHIPKQSSFLAALAYPTVNDCFVVQRPFKHGMVYLSTVNVGEAWSGPPTTTPSSTTTSTHITVGDVISNLAELAFPNVNTILQIVDHHLQVHLHVKEPVEQIADSSDDNDNDDTYTANNIVRRLCAGKYLGEDNNNNNNNNNTSLVFFTQQLGHLETFIQTAAEHSCALFVTIFENYEYILNRLWPAESSSPTGDSFWPTIKSISTLATENVSTFTGPDFAHEVYFKDQTPQRFLDLQATNNGCDPFNLSTWKSVRQLYEEKGVKTASFVDENGVGVFDVVQGKLGDCWFLSAVCSLISSGYDMSQIFDFAQRLDRKENMFAFKLWENGRQVTILVDDYLEFTEQTIKPIRGDIVGFEIWFALLEKAVAKYFGSYDLMKSGLTGAAFRLLTNRDYEDRYIRDWTQTDLFNVLHNTIQVKRLPMTVTSTEFMHAYSLLNTCTVDIPHRLAALTRETSKTAKTSLLTSFISLSALTEAEQTTQLADTRTVPLQLVCIRNPWGVEYSLTEENWLYDTTMQAVFTDMELFGQPAEKFFANEASQLSRLNTGIFYMTMTDFMARFTHVTNMIDKVVVSAKSTDNRHVSTVRFTTPRASLSLATQARDKPFALFSTKIVKNETTAYAQRLSLEGLGSIRLDVTTHFRKMKTLENGTTWILSRKRVNEATEEYVCSGSSTEPLSFTHSDEQDEYMLYTFAIPNLQQTTVSTVLDIVYEPNYVIPIAT